MGGQLIKHYQLTCTFIEHHLVTCPELNKFFLKIFFKAFVPTLACISSSALLTSSNLWVGGGGGGRIEEATIPEWCCPQQTKWREN